MTTVDEPQENKREHLPLGEMRPDDRGQDEVREDLEESIGRGEPRPLTREEREAAAHDPGPAKTVYAPASERVTKPPLPAHKPLFRRPTVNNNELSLGSVPIILAEGAARYRDLGLGRGVC